MERKVLEQHYIGNVATDYDKERKHVKKWQTEQESFESLLAILPEGSSLIDVPVGTGRFFPLYVKRGYVVEAVDISEDMLNAARQNPAFAKINGKLKRGSIFDLEYPDNSFDAAVSIRFLNLVDAASAEKAIQELNRVSRKYLIVGIRHLVSAKELKVFQPAGFIKYLRQAVSRVMKRAQGKIFMHRHRDVLDIFAKANLEIVRQECIEKRKDATDYNIYVLKKQRTVGG